MTLILNAAIEDAIIIAADSALTQSYNGLMGTYRRTLHGVQKLFVSAKSPCIISSWGDARLQSRPKPELGINASTDTPVQLWLEDFVARVEGSPTEVAIQMRDELEATFRTPRTRAGFDIFYFAPTPGSAEEADAAPQRLRVTNGDRGGPRFDVFRVMTAIPLSVAKTWETLTIDSIGDDNGSFWVDSLRQAFDSSLLAERDWEGAIPDEFSVERYLKLLVNTVANCREVMDVGRTVGGNVMTAFLHRDGFRWLRPSELH